MASEYQDGHKSGRRGLFPIQNFFHDLIKLLIGSHKSSIDSWLTIGGKYTYSGIFNNIQGFHNLIQH